MSEKKYLLSEQDLKCLFYSAWDCIISESNVVEFIKAYEYHERTCQMIDNGTELCCSECDYRHSYDDEPRFCMGCGAKVVEYGA